jgi:nucleoside-diphosphate-sugar epimerase
MRVLFIGGTGIISSECSQQAVGRGIELYLLNRGQSQRPVPDGARVLRGDIQNSEEIKRVLRDLKFDAVVDWIAFIPDHVQRDIDLFRDRTRQYIFISTAAVYQKPLASLPITESPPLANPYWEYARSKIACENLLVTAYRETRFPATIVRPSHTYDRTKIPIPGGGGFTMVDRMRKGKKVIVHGDGTSLWTLTHHQDFAKGFTGLLGNPHAIGDAFHITSDEILAWNQIYEIIARAAGTELRIVHVPSDGIAAFDAEWGAGLIGDKAHSLVFDNSKIKRAVPGFHATIPFVQGASEILDWYDADSKRRTVDEKFDRLVDRIVAAYDPVRLAST